MDAAEADFFYVPLLITCLIWPVASFAEHPTHVGPTRIFGPLQRVLGALAYIKKTWPYWDRRGGTDHLFFFSHDEGACWAPAAVWPAIMLSHWGRSDLVGDLGSVSGSSFESDNYDKCVLNVGPYPLCLLPAWMPAPFVSTGIWTWFVAYL